MRCSHRAVHRLLWPALAVVVALGLSLALALRPPIPIETGAPSAAARP